jgi:phenylacetate-coenzyme A ligase PaaK-like adenylate-forming protein
MSELEALNDMMNWPVYGLDRKHKGPLMLDAMQTLTAHHKDACPAYRQILEKLWGEQDFASIEALPFLPVRLFKHERLLSVPQSEVVKTMTSSGTSGQSVSQIFLDKQTSAMQVKVLSRIMGEFIGPRRLPMLVIDCRSTVANRLKFSARTAGILGFSMFGRDVEFVLDDDMSLNEERVSQFAAKHAGQPILIFGFTFIVWLHFLRWLESRNKSLALEQGILIHGGGWKQLQSQAVEPQEFKQRLNSVTGISRVHNYYGMVEQTGSIFMECEHGHLHSSAWSDVIVRDPINFTPLPAGLPGLIQLLSVIPRSYPGHSLLSEDEGVLLGVDDCPCGRMGSYFKVLGRIQNAETRGCSDTYTR